MKTVALQNNPNLVLLCLSGPLLFWESVPTLAFVL